MLFELDVLLFEVGDGCVQSVCFFPLAADAGGVVGGGFLVCHIWSKFKSSFLSGITRISVIDWDVDGFEHCTHHCVLDVDWRLMCFVGAVVFSSKLDFGMASVNPIV